MALDMPQTSCVDHVDIIGDFHVDFKGNSNRHQAQNVVELGHGKTIADGNLQSEKRTINSDSRNHPSNTEQQNLPNIKSEDFNQMSLEDKSENKEGNAPNQPPNSHPHNQHRHDSTSSNDPSAVSPSSATKPITSSVTEKSAATNTESEMNVKTSQPTENTECSSSSKSVGEESKSKCDEVERVEVKTVPKEDGLEDIIISVPVLQKSSPCSESAANVKSRNGHSRSSPGSQQVNKRPMLARRPTPVKIETPMKLLLNKSRMSSPENTFLEEEEEELE